MKAMAIILMVAALSTVVIPCRCIAAAPTGQADASNSTNPEKLNSQTGGKLHSLGVAREDSAYRYLAEKGAELFRAGRFGEAERYYRAALTNAENDGIHDRRLAMLVTNLATDLRQQQKYEESETLFERAVEIERRLKQKDEELMVYTAKQYAALLRETARDASGEAVIASAHNNFAMLPKIKGVDASNEDSSSEDDSETAMIADDRKNSKKIAERKPNDLFATRTELTPAAPPAQLGVMAELKMLADIEQGYMYDSVPQSQYLPSSFSYLNSSPLYSSPGFTGVYLGGFGGYDGFSGAGFGYGGGYGGNYGSGFRSHGGWHSGGGRGGGGHR